MGGWSIGELFGFDKEKEDEILTKVRKVVIDNQETVDGGKLVLIDLIEEMKDTPVEEGIFAMLLLGRAMGIENAKLLYDSFEKAPAIKEEV